jgi:hypothetical protein
VRLHGNLGEGYKLTSVQPLNRNRAKNNSSWHMQMLCKHCERVMGDYLGGYSRGYNNELLCHPNAANRPDCYKLVTLYKHSTPCDRKVCYEDHAEFMDYVNIDDRIPF